jgi:thymidine kinase
MPPRICIFTGPMFAGKTSSLIRCWNETVIPKLAFKFDSDIRYETPADGVERAIVSHNDDSLSAKGISRCIEINAYLPKDEPEVAVFIDEGQFFQDIKQWVMDMCPNNVTHVYISGLDLDIFGNKFNQEFDNLTELADECHTITANCYVCREPAHYTQFIDNNAVCKINGNVLIGGSEQYQPACKSHFRPIGVDKNN